MQQPSWKVKTKPCPFYADGTCVFGDVCNFQHDPESRHSAHRFLARYEKEAADIQSKTTRPIVPSRRLSGLLQALGASVDELTFEDDPGDEPSDIKSSSAHPHSSEVEQDQSPSFNSNSNTKSYDAPLKSRRNNSSILNSSLSFLSPISMNALRLRSERGDSIVGAGFPEGFSNPVPLSLNPPMAIFNPDHILTPKHSSDTDNYLNHYFDEPASPSEEVAPTSESTESIESSAVMFGTDEYYSRRYSEQPSLSNTSNGSPPSSPIDPASPVSPSSLDEAIVVSTGRLRPLRLVSPLFPSPYFPTTPALTTASTSRNTVSTNPTYNTPANFPLRSSLISKSTRPPPPKSQIPSREEEDDQNHIHGHIPRHIRVEWGPIFEAIDPTSTPSTVNRRRGLNLIPESLPSSPATSAFNPPAPHSPPTAPATKIQRSAPPPLMLLPSPIPKSEPTSRTSPFSARKTRDASLSTPLSGKHETTLMFAIASNEPANVLSVLADSPADIVNKPLIVGPMEQSALKFTLTNNGLSQRLEIFKILLAHGADPQSMLEDSANAKYMDAATRYLAKKQADARVKFKAPFQALDELRRELIGQDIVIDELCKVMNRQTRMEKDLPTVLMFCGPSGYGKSFLSRKFTNLLNIPTHTVNMTTLRSTHDLWTSHSLGSKSSVPLSDFLLANEHQRCIVVLDELDKVENEEILWSLLLPWESGYCSVDGGKHQINIKNVIWIGVSNIGHDLIFEFNDMRANFSRPWTKDEYRELIGQLRPVMSAHLGASILSRVTGVLPFVPFTEQEKLALAALATHSQIASPNSEFTMTSRQINNIATRAQSSYIPREGVRSLQRSVSYLLDDFDS